MNKIILHIPHSSNHIPFKEGYLVNQEILDAEMLKLIDWYTDDLFSFEEGIPIRADFARIFCDVERFADDALEVMAQSGMGVLYTHTDTGLTMREVSNDLRQKILDNYYWPHHQKLSETVREQLQLHGKALIVDCHSFPHKPLQRALDKRENRPDFNIGTDPFHTPNYLIEASIEFFADKGFSLGVDWPFRGSLVPMDYYQKDKKVESIMLEINRSLYLDEPTNEKSKDYENTKKVVREFLEMIHRNFQNA